MFPTNQMPNMQSNQVDNSQTSNVNGEEQEQVAIDPNQRVEVADPTKDFNIVPPPPAAGEYPVQWELAEKDPVDMRASKKVGTFLQCAFVGHIIAQGTEYDGYTINEYMNSIYNKMKGTSPLHDFLHKLGHTVPSNLSVGELKTFTENALAQKPVGTINLEWQASYKDPTDRRANDKGYVTIKNRMNQFPRNTDGSYSNQFPSPVDGSPTYARAYVSAHLKK